MCCIGLGSSKLVLRCWLRDLKMEIIKILFYLVLGEKLG